MMGIHRGSHGLVCKRMGGAKVGGQKGVVGCNDDSDDEGDGGGKSNANNDALDAHGGTRNKFKKRKQG